MQLDIQAKLANDPKMAGYLKENSYWYKYLNRNPETYKDFVKAMKEKYKIRVTDKIGDAVNNIDMISSVLKVLS